MSWDHGTFGRGAYDSLLEELKSDKYGWFQVEELGNSAQPIGKRLCRGRDLEWAEDLPLRRFRFKHWNHPDWQVAEEILVVDDRDCDGASIVSTIIYREGHRPDVGSPATLEA